MDARTRTVVYTTLAAIAMFTVSCSDDSSNDLVGASPDEMALATFSSGGSSSGPDQPPQPYAMIIEFGVDDEVIPGYTELPDPILFSTRTFEDDTNIIVRAFDESGFGTMARRLTDGEDTTVYVSMRTISGGGSSNFGLESQVLTYEPGLSRSGPDLAGYQITGLRVELDIEVTESAGRWTQAHTCTLTILGY